METLIHDHCPRCKIETIPTEVTLESLDSCINAAFATINNATPSRLHSEIVSSHSALLEVLCGYCPECSYAIANPPDPNESTKDEAN